MRDENASIKNLEASLRRISVQAPPLPEWTASPERKRGPQHTLGPAIRFVLAILAVAVLAVVFQVVTTQLPSSFVPVTPLRQVNAAWSAADGYVLSYDIFDNDPAAGQPNSTRQNFHRFNEAAFNWAKQRGIQLPSDGRVIRSEAPFVLDKIGGGGWPGRFRNSHCQITLRIDDASLVSDLEAELSRLPGVAEPEVVEGTLYFGLGGIQPYMAKRHVIINGTSYAFPQDFDRSEAQQLYWYFRGVKDNGPAFWAYPESLFADEQGRRRFELGDVIRMGLDGEGNLVISDVLKQWDIPVEKRQNFHQGVAGGWGFNVPLGVDESSIDPLEELRRKPYPLPQDAEPQRYLAHLYYWLLPKEWTVTMGSRDIPVGESGEARTTNELMTKTLKAWIEAHPQVKRGLVWQDRVTFWSFTYGTKTMMFDVSIRTNDLTEVHEIKAALAKVPGAPEPESNVTDVENPPFLRK
jgi:hypothetical protein